MAVPINQVAVFMGVLVIRALATWGLFFGAPGIYHSWVCCGLFESKKHESFEP